MLENLHVKNLALIEEEDITFLDGLHILSGETGAGKSIILGALGLALGGKVSKDMLRDPGKEALVEAVFRITRDSQRKQLAELDIEPYDDEVILRISYRKFAHLVRLYHRNTRLLKCAIVPIVHRQGYWRADPWHYRPPQRCWSAPPPRSAWTWGTYAYYNDSPSKRPVW